MAQTDPLRRRTDELYATGRYPNRTAAGREAYRQLVAEATRRHREYIDSLPED